MRNQITNDNINLKYISIDKQIITDIIKTLYKNNFEQFRYLIDLKSRL